MAHYLQKETLRNLRGKEDCIFVSGKLNGPGEYELSRPGSELEFVRIKYIYLSARCNGNVPCAVYFGPESSPLWGTFVPANGSVTREIDLSKHSWKVDRGEVFTLTCGKCEVFYTIVFTPEKVRP